MLSTRETVGSGQRNQLRRASVPILHPGEIRAQNHCGHKTARKAGQEKNKKHFKKIEVSKSGAAVPGKKTLGTLVQNKMGRKGSKQLIYFTIMVEKVKKIQKKTNQEGKLRERKDHPPRHPTSPMERSSEKPPTPREPREPPLPNPEGTPTRTASGNTQKRRERGKGEGGPGGGGYSCSCMDAVV